MTCKVSVIIPNYNYAKYLEERINSVLNQTYTDYELILLDDASTDNSAEILNKYKNHPKVSHLVINEKNSGGPFKQWMKGIRMAQGKWIWIAEADDSAKPAFLETCVRNAENHEDVSFVYTGTQRIDKDGNLITRPFLYWERWNPTGEACFPGKAFAEHNLYWQNMVANASSVLFSREKALTLQEEPFWQWRSCGDWMFWFRMALQGKSIVEVYDKLNLYRVHHSQTQWGLESGNLYEEYFRVITGMEKYLPEVSAYKRRLCHGFCYQYLRRMASKELKKRLQKYYRETFSSSPTLDYLFLKLNFHLRFLPFVLAARKDWLKKK